MAQDRKLQKLELTWVGKYDEQQPLEPRILIENPEYSYGRWRRVCCLMANLGRAICLYTEITCLH